MPSMGHAKASEPHPSAFPEDKGHIDFLKKLDESFGGVDLLPIHFRHHAPRPSAEPNPQKDYRLSTMAKDVRLVAVHKLRLRDNDPKRFLRRSDVYIDPMYRQSEVLAREKVRRPGKWTLAEETKDDKGIYTLPEDERELLAAKARLSRTKLGGGYVKIRANVRSGLKMSPKISKHSIGEPTTFLHVNAAAKPLRDAKFQSQKNVDTYNAGPVPHAASRYNPPGSVQADATKAYQSSKRVKR